MFWSGNSRTRFSCVHPIQTDNMGSADKWKTLNILSSFNCEQLKPLFSFPGSGGSLSVAISHVNVSRKGVQIGGIDKLVIERSWNMVFLCWDRPSPEDQNACIDRSGDFNYDNKFRGATAKPAVLLKKDKELAKDGFLINHSRVLVGSGFDSFKKGKNALQNWRHFALNWAFVDNKTPVQNGVKFCVCVKEFFPWLMMPLQVVYTKEDRDSEKALSSFGFAGGTLKGHLLAGEERFSVTLDESNQVWYEILSFSKPAHVLSFFGYPYVLVKQKIFAHQSTNAIRKHISR